MPRKAKVVLRQGQAELLLSGKGVVIRLPVDVTELEISLDYASAEERRKAADGFKNVGSESPFDFSSFSDMFAGMFKK